MCVCVRTHKNDEPATRTHVYTHAESALRLIVGGGGYTTGFGKKKYIYYYVRCTWDIYNNNNICVYIIL